MKHKKKIVVLISAAVLCGLTVLVLLVIIPLLHDDNEEDIIGSLAWEYKLVRESHLDILIRGEDVPFEYKMRSRKVEQIDADTVNPSENKPFIVIVDREGKLLLSQEEIEYIRKCIYVDRIPMIYIGTQYAGSWKSSGQEGSYTDMVGNKCISYTWEKGQPITTIGFWDSNAENIYKVRPEILGDTIVAEIRRYIEGNT